MACYRGELYIYFSLVTKKYLISIRKVSRLKMYGKIVAVYSTKLMKPQMHHGLLRVLFNESVYGATNRSAT
jgi:hypothetical protein